MSRNLLDSPYLAVTEARTRAGLHAEMVRFTQQLSFDTFTATVVVDRPGDATEFRYIDNAPPAYREVFDNPEHGKVDPVMQHCKTQGTPIAWDQSTYVDAKSVEKWEQQASFGYRAGICFAMHLPGGLHFVFGADRDGALPADTEEIVYMAGEMQMFAAYAQEAAMRILLPQSSPAPAGSALTPRELECLRWTMEGKTAWELGRILGIAEQTAVRHLYNATRKLECSGKHHAVIRALRLGLIR